MAVSTDNAFSGPYVANGATTVFPFTFTAPTSGEAAVEVRDATGALIPAPSHTAIINAGAGGSIVFSAPPQAGYTITPYLDPAFTQDLQFENGSAWAADPVNEGYDRSAARDQALKRDVDRALKAPLGRGGLEFGPLDDGQVLALVGGRVAGVTNDPAFAEDAAQRAEAANDDAQLALAGAAGARLGAEQAETGAEIARDETVAARDQAQTAAAIQGYYPDAAKANVPRQVVGTGAITGGSGGTNGTFALGFTGGNFSINPAGTFTVTGGSVTAINISGGGLYIGGAPTVPTLTFGASAGLTGAAASLLHDFKVPAGSSYLVQRAGEDVLTVFYNNAGAAQISSPLQTILANVNSLTTSYTLRLDETATENLYSAAPARYGYGTHRDLTEIANGKLAGRVVVGLRPSVAASAKIDVYQRPKSVTGVNTTAPGRHAADVLVSSRTLAWAESGGVVGVHNPVTFDVPPFPVDHDLYTYGFDPRYIDGSGVAVITGVAAILASHTDRTALFYRTATPDTWALTTSYTMALDVYEADTLVSRDAAFKNEVSARKITDMNVGSIQSSLTGWYEPAYSAFTEGAYYQTGNGALINNANYHCLRYTITGAEQQIRFTSLISGNSTGIICFNSAGTYIGVRFQGSNGSTTQYTNQLIDIAGLPAGTASIAVDGLNSSPILLEIYKARTDIAAALGELEQIVAGLLASGGASKWLGLLALWFGTSIPAGFGGYGAYPALVAAATGMSITNYAISSSPARNGIASRRNVVAGDTYGWAGWTWQGAFYALSGSTAEKEDLIANYDTKWKAYWAGQPGLPATLDAPTQAAIRASSYEVRLLTPFNVVFLDHGHNDSDFNLSDAARIAEMCNTATTGPGQTRDRGTYLGAMMFLIDKIREKNPYAQIVLVPHYEDARKPWIYQAQDILAGLTDLPYIRLYKTLGWTQQILTGSGPNAGKTMTQFWMLDDLHPGTDPTGRAPRWIAAQIVAALANISPGLGI